MRKFIRVALCLSVVVAACGLVWAAPEKRASPHEQTTATVGGKKITIEYGRPYKKGRDVYGNLVPFGAVWRLGADEATTLTTEADLTIGTVKVPKGKYSLFMLPTAKVKEWPLVINKVSDQWGSFKYAQKQDLGRTMLKVDTAPAAVEQFTIAIEPQADGKTAQLKISWDTTVASVPVTVQ